MLNIKLHCDHPRVILGKVPITEEHLNFLRTSTDINGKIRRRMVELATRYKRVPILVPCGKCAACRWEIQKQWMSRLNMETSIAEREGCQSFYVTLTIAPEYYPKVDNTEGCKEWYRKYAALFFARLRAKRGGNLKFRYYMACEFGDQHSRFHMHMAIWIKNPGQIPINEFAPRHKVTVGKRKDGKTRLQTVEEASAQLYIEKYWDFGFVEKCSWLNQSTSMYITKYVTKSKEDEKADKCPFHRQSLGLGIQWIRDHEEEVAHAIAAYSPCRIDSDKYKFKVPRYYKVKAQKKYGVYYPKAIEFAGRAWNVCCEALRQYDPNKIPVNSIAIPNKNYTHLTILHSPEDLPECTLALSYDDFGEVNDAIIVDEPYTSRYFVNGKCIDWTQIPISDIVVGDMPDPQCLEWWYVDYLRKLYENGKSIRQA